MASVVREVHIEFADVDRQPSCGQRSQVGLDHGELGSLEEVCLHTDAVDQIPLLQDLDWLEIVGGGGFEDQNSVVVDQ